MTWSAAARSAAAIVSRMNGRADVDDRPAARPGSAYADAVLTGDDADASRRCGGTDDAIFV